MIDLLYEYDPPRGPEERHGDQVYFFARVDAGPLKHKWAARDWRASKRSNQPLVNLTGTKAYEEKRIINIKENRRRLNRTLDDLRGKHAGRTAYCILSGPSAKRDLERNPPKADDIVIGYNRGATYWPCDYVLIADGIVGETIFDDWGGLKGTPAPIACQWSDHEFLMRWSHRDIFWFRPAGHGPDHWRFDLDHDLPELEFILMGGTMMPHLTDVLGCSTVILVGADHAVAGNEHYAGEKHLSWSNHHYLAMFGKNGETCWTTWEMWMSAKKLEAWAWIMGHYGMRFVNLTGGGIVMKNWERER